MARLERMLPVLLRPGEIRRGQVILSADEAWDLMTTTGPRLVAAGFDVRAPQISRRRSSPSLRVTVDSVSETAVGAQPARERSLVGAVRRRRAHRGRHRAAGEGSAAARAYGRSVGRARQGRPAGRGRSARGARHQTAVGRGDAAARAWARRHAVRRAHLDRRWRLGVGPAGRSRNGQARAHTERVRRQAAQLSDRSAGVARLPRLGRVGRLPRARHGARQDTDAARARAGQRRRRAVVGDRAAGGRGELGRGGRALHPALARRGASRREPRRRRRARGRGRRRRSRRDDVRHRGARCRGDGRGRMGSA